MNSVKQWWIFWVKNDTSLLKKHHKFWDAGGAGGGGEVGKKGGRWCISSSVSFLIEIMGLK